MHRCSSKCSGRPIPANVLPPLRTSGPIFPTPSRGSPWRWPQTHPTKFAHACPRFGRFRPTFGRYRRNTWHISVDLGPKSVDFGPASVNFGRLRANFGQIRPLLAQIRSRPAQLWPILGPRNPSKLPPAWSTLAQADLGRNRAKFKLGQPLADLGDPSWLKHQPAFRRSVASCHRSRTIRDQRSAHTTGPNSHLGSSRFVHFVLVPVHVQPRVCPLAQRSSQSLGADGHEEACHEGHEEGGGPC